MNTRIAKLLYQWHDQSGAPLEVRSYIQQMADHLAEKLVSEIASTLEEEAFSIMDVEPETYGSGYRNGMMAAAQIIRECHKAELSK